MRHFAMGAIYGIPAGANPTPIPIAILKDATVSDKVTKKYLRGQFKYPVDAGEGPVETSLKIKGADFRAATLAMVLAGTTTATGSVMPVTGEGAVIPATPFQVTVVNSANFVEDGGVLDLTAGKWLTRVAAAPTTGQYSVAAGLYTFAAADTAHNVSIVYSFTSTGGTTVTYANQVMGPSTGFKVRVYNQFPMGGVLRPIGRDYFNVHFESHQIGYKAEDWAELDLEGKVVQDTASTSVWKAYFGE